jgi:4-alpha-glucanotransferase
LTAAEGDGPRRLAHAHGIALSYTANDGRRVRTPPAALRSTLVALGVPVDDVGVAELLTRAAQARRLRPLEPVVVLGGDGTLSSPLVVPAETDFSRCQISVNREDGEVVVRPLSDLIAGGAGRPDSAGFVDLALGLGELDLPAGYHEIVVAGLAHRAQAMLLVPPRPPHHRTRRFGVFAPVYALRGRADWGVGTFSDLGRLADYVGAHGGELVGTLPMFATFFTPPVDPSPYLPVSRQFSNELFIDVGELPELASSAAARSLVATTEFRGEAESLAAQPMVAYGEVMALKRAVLELCAAELYASSGPRRDAFETYLADHPEVSAYADFRAAAEQLGTPWRDWSSAPGSLPPGAGDSAVSRYHRYVQFVAAQQLEAVSRRSGTRAGLYLDLPVGVHPDGFDTWSESASFAPATVGAPPDRLAPQGQAWGFPPLHPERIREDHYRYVISCYRHLFAHARAVRLDHVLGLQRLFWIPPGADATHGAYVRYRSEELRAIVAIEAARADVMVVGEDLGTVPTGIRQAMDRDGMLHSFVYQFDASPQTPFPQPGSPSMASLGSHDLPRFAGFWRGSDIDDRVAREVTTQAAARVEHADRRALVEAVEPGTAPVPTDAQVRRAFRACAESLAAGPAPAVMIDLADIEGETEPDNRPGTGPEADNWRRRLSRPLDAITEDNDVTEILTTIAKHRRHGEPIGVSA